MEHNNSAIDPHCCVVHGYTKVMRTLAAGPASITIWECPKCATAPAANYVHTDLPLNTTVTVYNPSAERVKELEAENARILSTVAALTAERDALKAECDAAYSLVGTIGEALDGDRPDREKVVVLRGVIAGIFAAREEAR
jgi:ribosomal protein L37AE/L43A